MKTTDPKEYMEIVSDCLNSLNFENIYALSRAIHGTIPQDQTVFVVGNGGSAATASHFAQDLAKNSIVPGKQRLRVLSLTDNVSWLTALANDISYDAIFREQLLNLAKPGDLFIGISVSGNSKNVIEAAKIAEVLAIRRWCLVGGTWGELSNICPSVIHVSSKDFGVVESVHSTILHWVVDEVRRLIEGR